MTDDFQISEDYDTPDHSEEIDVIQGNREAWEAVNSPIMTLDILSQKITRPPWLFEDFLLSNTLTMISGEPFAGKSLCLMAMLASIDSCSPLFGSFAPPSGKHALFIGQDSPTWDYLRQYQKLTRSLQLPMSHFTNSIMLLNKGLTLLDAASMRVIEEGITHFNISILMIDTLLDVHDLDENSNSEMRRVMACLKYLRDHHRLSVFFTTHTGKSIDGKSSNYRARGASVISGSVDQHILISSNPDGGFRVKTPKSRGADKRLETINVKFSPSLINDSPALALQISEDPYLARQETILKIFADRKPHSRKEVITILSTSNPDWSSTEAAQRASNSLKYLTIKGLLRKLDWGVYALPESPAPPPASNPS